MPLTLKELHEELKKRGLNTGVNRLSRLASTGRIPGAYQSIIDGRATWLVPLERLSDIEKWKPRERAGRPPKEN